MDTCDLHQLVLLHLNGLGVLHDQDLPSSANTASIDILSSGRLTSEIPATPPVLMPDSAFLSAYAICLAVGFCTYLRAAVVETWRW